MRIIFTDTEHSNWTWDPVARQYYWHRFFSHQPDLNYDNPAGPAEMLDIMAFWLDRGIDGFRVDAVPYLIEREGTNCENLPETHQFLKEMRRLRRRALPRGPAARRGEPVAERPAPLLRRRRTNSTWRSTSRSCPGCSWPSAARTAGPIVDIMAQMPSIPPSCQWALFLRNHDELTLEMVTDEERDYMYEEYAKDPRMRINLGIRRRLAPLMENGRRQMELLHSLLFTLPGTPVLYYGDEIGMGDNIHLGDRNGVRTPMQWSGDRNAGFSRADPSRLYPAGHPRPPLQLPGRQRRGPDPVAHLAAQLAPAADPGAEEPPGLRPRLARVRPLREPPGRGLPAAPTATIRSSSSTTSPDSPSPPSWTCAPTKGPIPVEMIGNQSFPRIGSLPYFLTLSPHSFFWFRLDRDDANRETKP